ncbi:MAG: hypothetical protein J6M12_07030 [Clostridia bacterium]|nr:hypothetical protein [Clostridia bacterium]
MSIFIMNFKRNMKSAFKTIKSNFKEYLCFFMALIMVELLFGVITVSFQNNRKVEKQVVTEAGYDYHAYLSGFASTDLNILHQVYNTLSAKDKYFTYSFTDAGVPRINFSGDLENSRSRFIAQVVNQMNAGGSARVALITTPYYDLEISDGEDIPGFIALLVLLSGLSFLLLMALFRIRINHFKFTYSIYMAFGGDFKKLTQSAFYEILLIALLSFVPALPLSYLISALLYLPFGQPFGFYPLSLPIMLILPLICSLLALLLPMRVLASGNPSKLMKAQDNSNYVHSVRRSKIFLKKSPVYTELWAFWRFRSYIAVLLLSTVSFAILFNVGWYLSDVYTVRTEKAQADITLDLTNSGNYDLFKAFFDTNAKEYGIAPYILEKTAVDPNEELIASLEAAGLSTDNFNSTHLAIPTERIESGVFTLCPGNNDYSATDALTVLPYDEDAAECFEQIYGYNCVGDPSKLLTDPNAVIISSHLANKLANSVKPGDTVLLPVDYIPIGVGIGDDVSTFEQRLENYVYTYRSFTVAAVITNYANYSGMVAYLPTLKDESGLSAYGAVTGAEPDYSRIKIHLENDNDESVVLSLIQKYITNFGGISIRVDYGTISELITEGQNNHGMILILSMLVFAVSPLAGFFSQILFYKKRHLEFDVLRAVGATSKDLIKIFTVDGILLALLSGLTYLAGTFAAIHLLCYLLNTPYVFMFIDSTVTASTFYPVIAPLPFFIGLVLTMLFSLAQVALCGIQYKQSISDHIAADFTQVDEI